MLGRHRPPRARSGRLYNARRTVQPTSYEPRRADEKVDARGHAPPATPRSIISRLDFLLLVGARISSSIGVVRLPQVLLRARSGDGYVKSRHDDAVEKLAVETMRLQAALVRQLVHTLFRAQP